MAVPCILAGLRASFAAQRNAGETGRRCGGARHGVRLLELDDVAADLPVVSTPAKSDSPDRRAPKEGEVPRDEERQTTASRDDGDDGLRPEIHTAVKRLVNEAAQYWAEDPTIPIAGVVHERATLEWKHLRRMLEQTDGRCLTLVVEVPNRPKA